MCKFRMKLLYKEYIFFQKQSCKNFEIILALSKLDMVGSRVVSNGLIFFRWYSVEYPVSNLLLSNVLK